MAKKPDVPVVNWHLIPTGTVGQPTYRDCPCPKDPTITCVMLTTCAGCSHNKGLGPFIQHKCEHPNASQVVRDWAERVKKAETKEEAVAPRRQETKAEVAPTPKLATPGPTPPPAPKKEPAPTPEPAQMSLF